MRTRNSINNNISPKPAPTPPKKTPPKKAAAAAAMVSQIHQNSGKSPPTPATIGSVQGGTPSSDSAEAVEVLGSQVASQSGTKPASSGKTTRKVVKKVTKKTNVRVPKQTSTPIEADIVLEEDDGKVENEKESEVVQGDGEELPKPDNPDVGIIADDEQLGNDGKPAMAHVDDSDQDQDTVHKDEFPKKDEDTEVVELPTENVAMHMDKQQSSVLVARVTEDQETREVETEEKMAGQEKDESKDMEGAEDLTEEMIKTTCEENVEPQRGKSKLDENTEEPRKSYVDLEDADEDKVSIYDDDDDEYLEHGQDDYTEGEMMENVDEAETLKEEHAQLDAVAQERKSRKELEVFVGGLDREATEEDVKKVFQYAGEVVDVRVHKDPLTNKNKGYAFIRFATKEQARRALSEMKNPVIRGKRCGTAATEDNDTLFLGNICNSWTKEAVSQKLKEYGIEGVERITLVADPRHEGLSRGFAFVEFSSHGEAMSAYKRLQKPDAVFGHPDRTAKVAFAEPLREPDPDVMAQVKSVFIDGLPPYWNEERVRDKFKSYGEIARITLARHMSTAKRKDFGFVDFTTHEAALACVDGINNTELGDGNLKTKVRARLSNPLPKTQAVKGGMVGGFRIGRGSSSTFQRFGRGFGRGGQSFNRSPFQPGTGFYPRGPGQSSRMSFDQETDYPPYHGPQNFGCGGRWGFRGRHEMSSRGPPPERPYVDRSRHGPMDRTQLDHNAYRRQPFPYDEGYNRSYMGRHYDEPYYYDDSARGGKRPYYMMDQEADYAEPPHVRARMDYSDPAVSFRGNRTRDAYGAYSRPYSRDYYGADYGGGSYPPFDGADRPYGRGYY
ncbi:RNA metabolism protein [Lithospermum erythrorhizon]|uniref:RNA metabolism protein n=1 Tax=Lithospermum erythrorhizon TaxID=34254 RepID=A0AAV3P222_LITER